QDELMPAGPNGQRNVSKSEETCYTLQQGDLFLFKRRESQTSGSNEATVSEQVAAYDGQTTRSVVYGNCVNVSAAGTSRRSFTRRTPGACTRCG
ncbi:MAG: hypothetical protein ACREHD_06500, partial [Pirellulales bacterium]